jgi:hypothetical protein
VTPHAAFYSEAAAIELREMAASEVSGAEIASFFFIFRLLKIIRKKWPDFVATG